MIQVHITWLYIILNHDFMQVNVVSYYITSYDTILNCIIWYNSVLYRILLIDIVSFNTVWNMHIIWYSIITLYYTFCQTTH